MKTEREVSDILTYNLEHFESIQSFTNNMGELQKKQKNSETNFQTLPKVNFESFFLKYVEIKYSLQTQKLVGKKIGLRCQKCF